MKETLETDGWDPLKYVFFWDMNHAKREDVHSTSINNTPKIAKNNGLLKLKIAQLKRNII